MKLALSSSRHRTAVMRSIGTVVVAMLSCASVSAQADTIANAPGFAEPLLSTSKTASQEDLKLGSMLASYGGLTSKQGEEQLLLYAEQHPDSGWTAGIWANLGAKYYHEGHFSKALEAWQKSWALGRNATDPQARAMIDGAVSKLAGLYANLGKMDKLAELLADVGDRPISGSATEEIQAASELLKLSRTDPRHLYICGPLALKALALEEGAKPSQVDFLQWYKAGADGTNFEELKRLAEKLNLVPSVVRRGQVSICARI